MPSSLSLSPLSTARLERPATLVIVAAAAAAAGLSAIAAANRLVQRRRLRRAIEALLLPSPTAAHDEDGAATGKPPPPPPPPCIGLAVDVGSSSVRCSAYVLQGTGAPSRATAIPGSIRQVTRDALDPATGTADAGAVLADVEKVLDGCLGALRSEGLADRVGVVGFAAFVMNLVGVDEAGRPVTPVLTYADRHASTSQYVAKLKRKLAGQPPAKGSSSSSSSSSSSKLVDPIYEATGAPVHAAYAPAQLWRLAAEEPETLRRVHKWQTLVSLALARWTGQPFLPVSYSEASWTGLLDFRALAWCQPLLHLLRPWGFDAATLPPLADYDEGPRGDALAPPYAARWPELATARTRFCLGVGDGACANLGSGCRDVTRLAVTIGTSAAARVVVDGGPAAAKALRVPPGLWCYRVDRARLLLGGALTDGGSLVQWMARTLRIESPAAAEAEARLLPPGGAAPGLAFLPFLSGERAPGWAPDATGAVSGLTRATTPAHLYRAGLEAVALRLGRVVELLAASGALALASAPGNKAAAATVTTTVGASGTALERSPLWRQILADVLGLEVVLGRVPEATSRGAALLMAEAVFGRRGRCMGSEEAEAEEEEAEEVVARHVPDPLARGAYRAAMRRQAALYEALYRPAAPKQQQEQGEQR